MWNRAKRQSDTQSTEKERSAGVQSPVRPNFPEFHSKDPRSKLRDIFKPTPTHYACPFVRDLRELPVKSFPQTKVTYWVTLVFCWICFRQ
jgi:hypothetical protein